MHSTESSRDRSLPATFDCGSIIGVDALSLGSFPEHLPPPALFSAKLESTGVKGSAGMSEKYIMRSSAIAARMLGGEMMIMSVKDSTFFTLDPVATAIWQAADGRTALSEIVATKICPEFDVSLETAVRDAEQFAEELASRGILRISDLPISGSEQSASVRPTEVQ
jgi:hypothetical protein